MTSSRNAKRKNGLQVVCSKLIVGLFLLLFPSVSFAGESTNPKPHWIWGSQKRDNSQSFLITKTITLAGTPKHAELIVANNFCKTNVAIDRVIVGQLNPYEQPLRMNVTAELKQNNPRINLICSPIDGPSALMCRLIVEYTDGKKETFVTDDSWEAFYFGLRERKKVVSLGEVDPKAWGLEVPITIKPTDDYTQWKQALKANQNTRFEILDGFKVSLIRAAKEDEDSWIAMTFDPKGRLIVSKEKKGLLRLTLNSTASKVIKTEVINTELRECRGLLFANDSLFAMANNDKALFQLRDSTGDDLFDEVTKLTELPGDVGHGRNQIRLGPDGKIYLICGDAVFESKDATSLVPSLVNPTEYEKARSGYLARFDLKTKEWEIISRGLRNPYGIDFNSHGEIFTYDADAEYDMGASWYRPTRVNQIFPGSDFGWRRVTKKWPPYFHDRPDMPKPVLDIGKGSPTSVLFGTKSNFPKTYQKALFVLDWAYGRILAVHFEPQGGSYQASPEVFLRGRPLNVTDLKFGPDGAMYFITGGRKTQSALYRVEYVGPKQISTRSASKQKIATDQHAKRLQKIRVHLESKLGENNSNHVALAWQYLSHDDPTIRTTARTLLEWQKPELWKNRIKQETNLKTILVALLALVRVGETSDHELIADQLNRIPRQEFQELDETQIAEAVFIFNRLNMTPKSKHYFDILGKFDSIYPHRSSKLNLSLSRLLCQHEVTDFTKRTIKLLQECETPEERFHYLFVLRNVKAGWTEEFRETYFDFLAQASDVTRGAGLPNFLKSIQNEAIANVSSDQQEKYQLRLDDQQNKMVILPDTKTQRPFVREWTIDLLKPNLSKLQQSRNLQNGQAMFRAAKCNACHRINRQGGVLGPDLTSAAGRYSPVDLLKSILKPSEVIAPKYQSHTLVLENGKTISGMILPGDYRSEKLEISTDPLDPAKQFSILKTEIAHMATSSVSIMPKGLLNSLSEEDVLDLIAYILAASTKPEKKSPNR